jgi:hypothetical protein
VSALALVALAGCGDIKSTLGLDRKAPDEFSVVSRAPLSLPPSYALRPPSPGEPRPQDAAQREQARASLLGVTPAALQGPGEQRSAIRGDPNALTPGETALLGKVGAASADPDIRRKVGEEQAVMGVDDRNLVERLMFWRSYEAPVNVVDARKEQQRIQESAATGKPITGAGATTIERKGGASNKGISLF